MVVLKDEVAVVLKDEVAVVVVVNVAAWSQATTIPLTLIGELNYLSI